MASCSEEYNEDGTVDRKVCVCSQISLGCTNVEPGPCCDDTDSCCLCGDTALDCFLGRGDCVDCDIVINRSWLETNATSTRRKKYTCFGEIDFTNMVVWPATQTNSANCDYYTTYGQTKCMEHDYCADRRMIHNNRNYYMCSPENFNATTKVCTESWYVELYIPATYEAGLCTLCSVDWATLDIELNNGCWVTCAQRLQDRCVLNPSAPKVCSTDRCNCDLTFENRVQPWLSAYKLTGNRTYSNPVNCLLPPEPSGCIADQDNCVAAGIPYCWPPSEDCSNCVCSNLQGTCTCKKQ